MKKLPAHITTASERRMAADFRLFLWYIFRELGLPDPTPIQYAIAEYLQHGPRRLIIQAFRGVGKSWITAAFVLWLLWRDPDHRVMVVSANEDRALQFSTFVKQLIDQVPLLKPLRGGHRAATLSFDVGPASPDQAPSVRAVGITGQLTGGRADTIVADDVEVPKNSRTETQRELIAEAVKEFDAVLKPAGRVLYLGTPQVGQSLYVKLRERGYETRIWPARYVQDHAKYAGSLAPEMLQAVKDNPSLVDTSTEPTRFSDLDLAEREASYGRSGFALQFMLDTSLSDALRYPLKASDLIVMDADRERAPVALTWASGQQQVIPELPNVGFNGDRYHRPMYVSPDFAKYATRVMHVDPSGRGRDETAYCITAQLNGWIWVLEWGGLLGGYDDTTLDALALMAKDHSVHSVQIEDNYGDGMFTALFKPVVNRVYPVTVEGYKVKGMKEERIINALEPILNQHRLVIDRKVIDRDFEHTQDRPQYSGMYQLTHLQKVRGALKQDDRVDVLGSAVAYHRDLMELDTHNAERRHRSKMMDQELKKFAKSFIGRGLGPSRKRRWMQA